MVGLRTLERTAVFAWSPGAGSPLLVTGTKVGALGDDFSSETKVELWQLGLEENKPDAQLQPVGSVTTDAGFNDIAWSEADDEHPLGVIAGALENGSVDLWDAQKLRNGSSDAFISRTTKHSGIVKALQWNPWRHNLLASVGAKGEIFIYDVNNMANPFRLGASAARADDIECLDWNKQEKTAHILATGSSGGSVTVWDVKQKKDVFTLSNQGRKAVSAVAWDPEQSTRLATATANDQDPVVLIWSLRNSSAPEKTLKGHELGVLGLSWCIQDPDLLLSCGKDNRTICWNPKTGEQYGEFTAGSNWAFQTEWNPHNPSLIASASFDGKILITSTQSTNSKPEEQAQANQSLDAEDFFAKAQTQPQGISFTLPKAPKWAARPASVAFGFGGKLVRVSTDASKKSKVAIETFSADTSIGETAEKFETKLKSGDVAGLCASKIEDAKTEEEKADWRVIETLNAGKSRKKLREYLGFDDQAANDLANQTDKLAINGDSTAKPETNGEDDDFFGSKGDSDNFLADLAAAKGAKTNNPFSIYTGSETEADKSITRALMLGEFEAALDICLKEDRISDAFMIAVCGGQKCIDKAQSAYLKKKSPNAPNYLRLLASIVGKNLWDVVHNADLDNWKEVMATLCTYADEKEFSDLCEALGDRLEDAYQEGAEKKSLRRDASFCYLAGSKLEKVVINWVQELREQESSALKAEDSENDFSVHAQCLQEFIEKVSVFRKVTAFRDPQMSATDDWKLAPLYRLYTEYAEILVAHGQLATAEQYLDFLPSKFNGAESAQTRIRHATRKAAPAAAAQRQAGGQRSGARTQTLPQATIPTPQPLINQARNAAPSAYTPADAAAGRAAAPQGPYAPTTAPSAAPQGQYAPPSNTYTPAGFQPGQPAYGAPSQYGGYQPPQQAAMPPPPPRGSTSSPSIPPPSAARNMSNWNDMPDNFFKAQPNSRRGTPGPQPISSPFPNAQPQVGSPPPPTGPPQYGQQRTLTPLPPPPKAGEAPPRVTSPPTGPPQQSQGRPSSSTASAYAPSQPTGSTLPAPMAPPPINRGASPYQPPPSTSTAAPSNRYAPAPGSQPSQGPGMMPPQRQVAPNPYAAQQQQPQGPYAPQQPTQQPSPYGQQQSYGQPPQQQQQAPPPPRAGPPPQGPPRIQPAAPPPSSGPPRTAAPQTPLPQTSSDTQPPTPSTPSAKTKHPRGDRSHIPPSAQPIVDILTPEIARIKAVAPQQYKPQVDDMEKRINLLFDHLNNEDLLSEATVREVVEICEAVKGREWDRAQGLYNEMQGKKMETEGTLWMVGLKRLINFGKVSKG